MSAVLRRVSLLTVVLLVAAAGGACSTGKPNHGVFSFTVIGIVANGTGTCVATKYSGPYSHNGQVCAGARLGNPGECIQFGVSNINAAHSTLPAIGPITVVDITQCSGL